MTSKVDDQEMGEKPSEQLNEIDQDSSKKKSKAKAAKEKVSDSKEDNQDQIKELETKIESFEEEKVNLQEQLLRKSADMENTRRRLIRDKEDAIRYANRQILTDLIDIMDNFERAIISGSETKEFESFFNGVEMIENQLFNMLDSKYGLKRFESKGEDFDPQRHEAVTMLPGEEERETQYVVQEFQKGYQLGERVLRHSKVAVSKVAQ